MLQRNGLRLLVEMGLIVAAAAIAGALRRGAWTIVAAVVVVWVAISIFEYARAHMSDRRPARALPDLPPDPTESVERVRILPAASRPEPEAPEPVAVAAAEPETPEPGSATPDQVQEVEPEPEPEPEPVALEPGSAPPNQVREDRPEPEPEPEPEPIPVASAPWSWNVWNLERVVRERASANEELAYLLLYLRDYANPAGMLPPDFDGLVRESFGDLLAAPA